jgi:hypothetical protein
MPEQAFMATKAISTTCFINPSHQYTNTLASQKFELITFITLKMPEWIVIQFSTFFFQTEAVSKATSVISTLQPLR